MGVIKNALTGLDQAANCLIRLDGEWGSPDEMLSARAWRLQRKYPRLHVWIDRLFFWDADHCFECYEIERSRQQLPPGYGTD